MVPYVCEGKGYTGTLIPCWENGDQCNLSLLIVSIKIITQFDPLIPFLELPKGNNYRHV